VTVNLLHSPPIARYNVTEMALKALESDLFSHVVSFLNLEECAVLMPTCRMMRQKVTELPAWGQAEAQLSARNSFDQCSHCEVPWRSPGHASDECTRKVTNTAPTTTRGLRQSTAGGMSEDHDRCFSMLRWCSSTWYVPS
jgi:hypothetical protein